MSPRLSVLLPAHDPHPARLVRTLTALRGQTLPASAWETLLIDNASSRFPAPTFVAQHGPANLRLLSEPTPGLTHARRRGFTSASAPAAVLVDDDNVLAPDFLEKALAALAAHPQAGTLGGPVLPEFETPPAPWTSEFYGLLALRDLGPQPIVSGFAVDPATCHKSYPLHAPVGAGMVLRRAAWEAWLHLLDHPHASPAPTDRKGSQLSSGGDNDIVLAALHAGWDTAYLPELRLTHLIPSGRLAPAYLAHLNRAIQRSWVGVLRRHEVCPWPAIAPCTVPLRSFRAWLRHRAWRSPAARIRWQGALGHFEGRATS